MLQSFQRIQPQAKHKKNKPPNTDANNNQYFTQENRYSMVRQSEKRNKMKKKKSWKFLCVNVALVNTHGFY